MIYNSSHMFAPHRNVNEAYFFKQNAVTLHKGYADSNQG